ncbi:MAG: hypothetical protein R6W70_08840, partial [bacterium]
MDSFAVREKAKAACEYCGNATEYNREHGEKPWKYVLIPHDEVFLNRSFEYFIKRWERQTNK